MCIKEAYIFIDWGSALGSLQTMYMYMYTGLDTSGGPVARGH